MAMESSSTRDKMIIWAITWIVSLGLGIVALFAWAGKYTEALAVMSSVSSATGLLGTAYKGLPAPSPDLSSPTATVTSTTETTTKDVVSDHKGQESDKEKE